jgi:hypothetical protein
MTVFRQPSDALPELVVREDEGYTTLLLPGFQLSLRQLFAEVDLLEHAQQQGSEE